MTRIERVELRLVDIPPKVRRTDAIQSFVSQETPIVAITDSTAQSALALSATLSVPAAHRSCDFSAITLLHALSAKNPECVGDGASSNSRYG